MADDPQAARLAQAGPMPVSGPLIDTFGRVADDLRVSVIDKCNLRCTYCMPAEGLPWMPSQALLSVEEIARVVARMVHLGVRAVKFTGGEPLARKELPEIVAEVRAIDPALDLSLTTNGTLLDRCAGPLRAAGLDRVTVSCDSLLPDRFAEMTRRDAFAAVHRGLDAAAAAGFDPIKLNVVVIRDTNDEELADFADFARRTGYEVRFIEYMPLDAEHAWERNKVVPSAEVVERIAASHDLVPRVTADGQPATSFSFADGSPGGIGVIASVTEPFCASCNRLRLTADGQLRNCLFSLAEDDLRILLRAGATDDELDGAIRRTVWSKWAGHRINHPDFTQPERSMSMIGG